MFLLFHNVFSTGNPITDLILFLIILVGFFVSHYLIIRGFRYLIIYWRGFSRVWQFTLALAPLLILGLTPIVPINLAWLTFPFGLFGWFPMIFFFDTREFFDYYLLGGLGTILNIIGFIGVGAYFEKRSQRKTPLP